MGIFNRSSFKKPRNTLENTPGNARQAAAFVPDSLCTVCPGCRSTLFYSDLKHTADVCPKCGHHFRIDARRRIGYMADEGSFEEWDAQVTSGNPIDFPEYDEKLAAAKKKSGESEAVLTGRASMAGMPCAIFAMNPQFMMGSMGSAVGEKITRLFERAAQENLPVVGFTVSGGARMQEGILSLMQMAKTSAAVERHSRKGLLYAAVLTDPTTGGVTASFAMQGDVTLAEPKALIGFAGPRVIEQTIRQSLPEGFQRAEFLMEKGFVDDIIDRREQREYLIRLLSLHAKEGDHAGI